MLRLSARSAQHYMEVLFVIRQKNCQPHKNQQRVTGKCARLQEADGKAEELRQLGAEVQQAVDNPLVPPHGERRAKTRKPAGAVHADAVNDFRVDLTEKHSQVFGTVYEESVVDFVDVVFVKEDLVKPAESRGDELSGDALGAVELVSQPET